jgi:hypothetical protein
MFTKSAALSTAFAGAAVAGTGIAEDCLVEYVAFLKTFPAKASSPKKMAIFCKSLEEVSAFNQEGSGWTKEINEFSDWSEDELSVLGGANEDSNVTRPLPYFEPEAHEQHRFPGRPIDWRNRMPWAKDQGRTCGSCWAFATIAIIDFHAGDSHSEQQLIDCDYLGRGCNGGKVGNALKYFMNVGSVKETQYPYTGEHGFCRQMSFSGPTVSKYGRLNGVDQMMHMLQSQVIAVEINMTPRGALRAYGTGIFDSDCGQGGGHSMAAVGYGKQYWIIRNSWGRAWGQRGHVYFAKGSDLCGIETRGPIAAHVVMPGAGSSNTEVVV